MKRGLGRALHDAGGWVLENAKRGYHSSLPDFSQLIFIKE